MKFSTKKIVTISVLCALSIVLMTIIHFPILPWAPFLIYEPADIPVLIGTFAFGPLVGLLIAVVGSTIQSLLFGGGGLVGLFMHLAATGTLVAVAGLIYKRNPNTKRAIVSVIAASLCVAALMVPLNLFIDTKFYGMPYAAVEKLILPAIIPFNLIKMGVNSAVSILLLKAIRVEGKLLNKKAA